MKNMFRNVKFFGIWVINSITSVNINTEFRPYTVAIICFLWLVGLNLMFSQALKYQIRILKYNNKK